MLAPHLVTSALQQNSPCKEVKVFAILEIASVGYKQPNAEVWTQWIFDTEQLRGVEVELHGTPK